MRMQVDTNVHMESGLSESVWVLRSSGHLLVQGQLGDQGDVCVKAAAAGLPQLLQLEVGQSSQCGIAARILQGKGLKLAEAVSICLQSLNHRTSRSLTGPVQRKQ